MQSVYYTGHIGGGRRNRSNLYTMEEFVDNIINDFPDIAEECQYRDDFNNCLIETSGAEKRSSFQRPRRRQGAGHIQQRRIEHYRPRNYSFDGKRKSSKKFSKKSKKRSSKKKSKKRKY
jgi:hypothetical protein